MNKKYIMFGVFGLLAMALVTAGLVNYLSETVISDVTVNSPILMEICESGTCADGTGYVVGGTVALSGFGGETETYYVRTTNQANVKVLGGISTVITNPNGVTCGDFNSLEMTTTVDGVSYGTEDVLGLCEGEWIGSSYNPNKVLVIIPNGYEEGDSTKPNWEAEEVDYTTVDVSFKTNALGDYSFATEIIPVTA